MFFTKFIHRKLSSLLQPWLRDELELELKLGFINSTATVKNIRLSDLALNLILEEESSSVYVTELNIGQLIIRFSNWSPEAFSLEVHGVHVTLSAREMKERGRQKNNKAILSASKDVKKRLSAIDPEGSALHDVLETILNTTPSRSWIKTSFLNLILNHCNLRMVSISVQLHLPICSDSFVYISELKELHAESQHFHQRCFFRGLVGSLFRPLKESSFDINGSGFEIGYKRNDQINHVFSSNELFACAKLDELQLVYLDLHTPELRLFLSPFDFGVFAFLAELSPKESKHARNGQLLWKIASRRLGHVISAPSLSLHNLVVLVSLWLRYVNAYAQLLFLLGYSADHFLKSYVVNISQSEMFLASVKSNWVVITDIEKELPAEAVAQARRIARYRAALNVQRDTDNSRNFSVNIHFNVFCKILWLLSCIWKVMCKIVHPIAHFLLLFRFSTKNPEPDVHLDMVSEYSSTHHCFCLNLEKISITFYPKPLAEPVNQRVESQTSSSDSDSLSFCLSVDALILIYTRDNSEKSLLISCGQLKVTSSTNIRAPPRRSGSLDFTASTKGHRRKGRVTNAKIVLWGEPADMFSLSETNQSSLTDHAEGLFDPVLEKFLGEMWSNWKRFCMQFDEREIEYYENPWFLCEIRSFLTYPDLKNPDSGLLKCNLTMGKLNMDLEYSSLLSLAFQLRHIQHAVSWRGGNGMSKASLRSQITTADRLEMNSDDKFESCASGIKMVLHRILPDKNIQIGVLIAGPHIQMSLTKIGFQDGNEEMNHSVSHEYSYLKFDVHNIKFVALPPSDSDLTSFITIPGSDGPKLECLRLLEHKITAESDDEKYACQGCIALCAYLRISGLNTYLVDFVRNQQNQIFALRPISFHLSSLREYVHSLTTTITTFSAALCGMAGGCSMMLFVDEMHALFQVVAGLSSEVSNAFDGFDLVVHSPFQQFMRQDIASVENEKTTENGASFILTSTLISLHVTFQVELIDIFCHRSRIREKLQLMKNIDTSRSKDLADVLRDCGVWISVHEMCIDLSCEEGKLEVSVDVSGIKSQLIRYEDHMGKSFDQFVLRNLQLQPLDCLHELALSNCIFMMWLGHPHAALSPHTSDTMSGSHSGVNASRSVRKSHITNASEKSTIWSHRLFQKLGLDPNISARAPGHYILLNIAFGEVLLTSCSLKNVLCESHQINKLVLSLSVGEELQSISCAIQGGPLLFEITALLVYVSCFSLYLDHIATLLSILQTSSEDDVHITGPKRDCIDESAEAALIASRKDKRQLEVLTTNVSQVSFILVFEEESRSVWELQLEVDAEMNLGMTNLENKLMIDISRLSILSQFLQESEGNESQIPRFSSVILNELSSQSAAREGIATIQYNNRNDSFGGASCSMNPVSQTEFSMNHCSSGVFRLSHQNYILKHLGVYLSAEKLGNNWIGSGSISGFDMTISLPELQMILSAVSSFSGISSKTMSSRTTERHQSINQESSKNFKAMVPDGAIVAIQDVDQHTYFTVEGGENKYSLGGAIHYSLVGERALFRVKYHNQKRWMSSVKWFSLISLCAKNDVGESLRLNYHSGSCFVDISSADDSSCALWSMLPCESESYKDDLDWETQNHLVKDTFYLVNKNNDCGVAFIDGIPEFVKKPGNAFKFKGFNLSVTHDSVASNGYCSDVSRTIECQIENDDVGKISEKTGALPCINIKIEKVALTVVHELLDTKDRFPLLFGCLSDIEIAAQILSNKLRVMSTSRAMISFFDAQRNLWRGLVHPIEMCTYYRSSSNIQGSETLLHRVPVRVYCRIKEFQIFLTELSLDILLFVIGKLDLAGPYLVRSSRILANCCKVENQSGLNLHCHFHNQQRVTIGRKQSASIFLRTSTLVNQAPDSSSVVSVQLSLPGSLTTSSIYLSLSEPRSIAWRTRIISAQDSRTFPGPFIVVDISRKSEDGLSIAVSPLIRVHNETEFTMELRFRRVQDQEDDFASILLKPGHSIDDSMAIFDAVSFSGGLKRALMSLSVGNFLFSFRPSKGSFSVDWSEEITGAKAVRLSGIFDKLSYEVRKALSVQSDKCSLSTAHCDLKSRDNHVASMHFLIQSIGRDVPITEPDRSRHGLENRSTPLALQEQKEIFLLPTVRVSNFLHLETHVLLTEADQCATSGPENIGKQATLQCRSTADFYANPAIMYFTITLTAFGSSCKPVNSSDWVKKLLKQKNDVHYLDIDLDFGAGKYFACLRLSRGQRGILEATIFTSYTLRNETDVSLLFYPPNQKPLSRDEVQKSGSSISPDIGLLLPPNSTGSWLLKSHKVRFRLLDDHSSEALLDLDALSGLTELKLEIEDGSDVKYFSKFGVSMGPSLSKVAVPSQTITIVPRHVVLNEAEDRIIVRQCYLEDDREGMISISSNQRKTLQFRGGTDRKRANSSFENFIRKHRNDNDKSLIYIQFRLDESELGWSGPLCISSLGRFFLKFRKESNQTKELGENEPEFAAVHVAEEGSTLVVHFHKPPNVNLPYRIENCLLGASVTYYQKDSSEVEVLGSGCIVDYVWDDLTLPHKLVVLINDMHTLREINLDKVRPWKLLFKPKQHRSLASYVAFDKKTEYQRTSFGEFSGTEIIKVGYEVRADGPTRVLRICESSDNLSRNTAFQLCAKIQLRISQFALHLLEHRKQDLDESDASTYAPIIVGRLGNIHLDSVFTDQQKFNQICVQSLNVELKWAGAPFAAMLRRHHLSDSDSKDCVLKIVCILLSNSSNVKQVKYSSVVLQPVNLNLDEESLMRIASFWRTSLSDSHTPSRQFYFDHFEILPVKIIANFLPGDSYSSYNSAQETLRSLLHSVVKVPSIKNMVVELNGVLVTHALITMRELLSKCGQHYLWYTMRSIYIAKGSPLLPPAFASIFDDLASSSLDVFFDPSYGLTNLPGLTLGTFKFISKCIDGKGFSGTKRYFGDLGKTLKTAGSNVLFAAVTEISDSVLRGAETNGYDGLVSGFHQGILRLAMEPSLLGSALIGGGADRKIKLDQTPGINELYIEGYLQAMLDMMYRQEYLRVRVIDNQVFLKNLPPNNSLINEIMDRVKEFLESEGLLKGDPSRTSRPLRQLRGENEWKIGPTVLTLCEHLFVSFAIRMLRRRADKLIAGIKWKTSGADDGKAVGPVQQREETGEEGGVKFVWKWGIGKFLLSGILAYIDGRLCRGIPNRLARRIVGGFLLSYLDKRDR